jgi:hypothetical protein
MGFTKAIQLDFASGKCSPRSRTGCTTRIVNVGELEVLALVVRVFSISKLPLSLGALNLGSIQRTGIMEKMGQDRWQS